MYLRSEHIFFIHMRYKLPELANRVDTPKFREALARPSSVSARNTELDLFQRKPAASWKIPNADNPFREHSESLPPISSLPGSSTAFSFCFEIGKLEFEGIIDEVGDRKVEIESHWSPRGLRHCPPVGPF